MLTGCEKKCNKTKNEFLRATGVRLICFHRESAEQARSSRTPRLITRDEEKRPISDDLNLSTVRRLTVFFFTLL